VRLTVDTIGEEEGVGASVAAPGPEAESPKAAWRVGDARVADANVNRDRAQERPGCGIEGVNLAGDEAEIANQQVAAERTETGRGESNAPWSGEGDGGAAKDRLQQCPTLGENRHRSHPASGTSLVWKSGRRISHGQIPVAEGLHAEGDESGWDRAGSRDCAHLDKGAVEDDDSAGTRRVGSVQLGLSLVDR
jgi:hypothetical protein